MLVVTDSLRLPRNVVFRITSSRESATGRSAVEYRAEGLFGSGGVRGIVRKFPIDL